jgi:nucleotide-binding universal stress UspA family protein
MREKILVPLDGSKVGEAALPYVENLVPKFLPEPKVEVTLIQVLSSLSHYVVAGEATARIPYTEEEIEQMKKLATAYLRKAAEGLKKQGATTKIRVVVGDAADEIIKAADEINADMIAMSTHGRSGLSRWAFGSVTDKILRGGNKPVLVVRAPKDPAPTSS